MDVPSPTVLTTVRKDSPVVMASSPSSSGGDRDYNSDDESAGTGLPPTTPVSPECNPLHFEKRLLAKHIGNLGHCMIYHKGQE